MLHAVFEYRLLWRMKFNFEKCNVIRFDNQRGRGINHGKCEKKCNCGHHYFFGSNLIKEVLLYKYLGMEFDFKEEAIVRPRMNMGRVWNKGQLWRYAVQSLVRSVLEYGCVVLGKEKWPEAEQVQA